MKLAVIPARGGSKRIPRKNVRHFCGKPMIAWSIEAALASGCFAEVIVSTDDDEIASVARRYGARVPFIRPPELSDDHTGTIPVIAHAIRWQQSFAEPPTEVCCIYATAPFIRIEDLQAGADILARTGSDYSFSVTSYPFPIQRAVRINEDNQIEMFFPEQFNTRSQDLVEGWHDAGQFYWGRTAAWLEGKVIFGPSSSPVRLPRYRVQDIDTEEDWARAEFLFKAQQAEAR